MLVLIGSKLGSKLGLSSYAPERITEGFGVISNGKLGSKPDPLSDAPGRIREGFKALSNSNLPCNVFL